jgi:hypothetical protein
MNLCAYRIRLGGLSIRYAQRVSPAIFVDSLFRTGMVLQLAGEQLTDLGIVVDIGELTERLEGLLDRAPLAHALAVFEIPATRVCEKPLRRAELSQLLEQLDTTRVITKGLVAKRDRVVVQTGLGVFVGRLFVILHCLGGTAQTHVKITNPVV